jgi:SWI/SNF-related matrix-associated actin-dependent regulator 1 of chromatin subfamily A
MSLKVIETPGEFIIEFPFDQVKVDAVRKLPGRAYQPLTKTWTVPARHKTEVQKFIDQFSGHHKFQEAAAQANYVIPPLPELTAEQEEYLATRLKPFNSKGEPQSLRHYQKAGIAYNAKHQRTIIGDTMRLGKSIQSISSVVLLNKFPCLCIVPATLKLQWEKEWRDWTYKKPIILDEKNYRYLNRFIETGLADVVIVNYESLKKYFVKEIKKPKGEKFRITDVVWQPVKDIFKSIIIDEFHKCKAFGTLQTRFVRGIAADKEVVFGLSGTPVVNNPMDLVPQLGILDQLDKVGGYKYYIDRYVGGQPSRFKKPKPRNLSELNFNLNQHCYYRRDMNDVFKDMPPKSRQIVECEITTREEYNKAENDLENYLETVKGYSIDQIDKSMRGKIMVQIGILKNISARGKMETVQDFIQETIDSGEKIIVFGNLTVVLDEVCRLFPSAVSVVGKDSMEQRNSNIQKFQNHPDCNIIVCNFRTGGVGIDLAASNIVSFIELDWTPAAHDQAEARAIKAGKTSAISCPYFIGKNTIDEHIYEIINSKRDIVSQITGAIDPTEEEKVSVSNLTQFISLFNKKRGI